MIEARGVIPPEIYGYQGEAVGFGFDADQARDHLEKYMERVGITDPSTIVVELWAHSGTAPDMEAIQVMWEDHLGIEVQLISMEWQTYVETLDTCKGIAAQE
jgi:hypothetical protein